MSEEIANTDSVDAFVSLVNSTAAGLLAAGEMLARMVKGDPDVLSKISKAAPSLPRAFLNRLLRVGEHSLHPELLLNGAFAYQRLSRLPYSIQERVLARPEIDLVIDVDSGDFVRVPLVDLTPSQFRQAIGPEGVRAKTEQQALLKRSRLVARAKAPDVVGPSYVIKQGRIVFLRPCELSRVELCRLMEELVA